jgi:hypothetical protein
VTPERLAAIRAEGERRRDDARSEAEGARRYAAWMRSAEGKAHRGEWIGLPETTDADAEANEEEGAFWDDVLALLGPP